MSGEVAICGVGESDHSKASGRTTKQIVAQAVERALADADPRRPRDIDGLMYVPIARAVRRRRVPRALRDQPRHLGVAGRRRDALGRDRALRGGAGAAGRQGPPHPEHVRGGLGDPTEPDGRRTGRVPRPGAVQAEPRGPVRLVPPARVLRDGRAPAHARVRHHPGAARRGRGRVPASRQPHAGCGDARPQADDGAVPRVADDRGAVPPGGLLSDLRRRRRVHHDDAGAGP